MVLKFGTSGASDYQICTGDARRNDGLPFGLSGVSIAERPGVDLNEYIGADRVHGEHIRCDHGVMTFSTTRVFGSVAAAVAWAMVGHRAEPKAGALKYDNSVIFENAVMTAKRISQVGVAVVTNYTIEG